MSRYISLAITITIVSFALLACQKTLTPEIKATPEAKVAKPTTQGKRTMKVSMKTNHGTITLELYPDKAPITVENFVGYVKDGFYNGTVFHRVIPSFMIQGGGMVPGMEQKETKATIKNEADNGLGNDVGTIAMARTPDPDSASSQFFINAKDNDFLNFSAPTPQGWGYCVFGKVVDGMDVVEAIEKVATGSAAGHQDVPLEDVIIEEASMVEDDAE